MPSISRAILPVRDFSRNHHYVQVGSDSNSSPRYYYVYNGHGGDEAKARHWGAMSVALVSSSKLCYNCPARIAGKSFTGENE